MRQQPGHVPVRLARPPVPCTAPSVPRQLPIPRVLSLLLSWPRCPRRRKAGGGRDTWFLPDPHARCQGALAPRALEMLSCLVSHGLVPNPLPGTRFRAAEAWLPSSVSLSAPLRAAAMHRTCPYPPPPQGSSLGPRFQPGLGACSPRRRWTRPPLSRVRPLPRFCPV